MTLSLPRSRRGPRGAEDVRNPSEVSRATRRLCPTAALGVERGLRPRDRPSLCPVQLTQASLWVVPDAVG